MLALRYGAFIGPVWHSGFYSYRVRHHRQGTERNKNVVLFTNQESKADILTEDLCVQKASEEKAKSHHAVPFILPYPSTSIK